MGWDKKHSLTGDEFLDFIAWGEAVGIDLFGDQETKDDNIEDTIDEELDNDDYQNNYDENFEYRLNKERKR